MPALSLHNPRALISLVTVAVLLLPSLPVLASAPDPGGATTVVNPSGEGPVSINEDAVQPESANIRLIIPTLNDPAGGTPSSIRILSVNGGTLWQSGGASITLGSAGTVLSLTSGKLDLRFRPDAGRDTNATFSYVVVDPHDSAVNSSASTATISINPVNDSPVLQTLSGDTGLGLAATYYIEEWDLTGPTVQRIDATVNFSNNFGVSGLDEENFSVRWSGQVKSPITGNVTFSTLSDDGVRLWVNDVLIIDNWTLHGTTTDTASPVSLTLGEKYNIRMEFYERGGGEVAALRWAYSGQSTQVIPQTHLFPATTRPALSYVNGAASAIIDDAITVADVDSTLIASGSVVISANYVGAEDSLLFTDQNGITGSYSAGTLRLAGSATLAAYQAALRSVRYANSDSTPTSTTRTITFTVTDANGGGSNSTFRNVTFTATNTPPVITEGASTSVTMDQNGSPTAFSLTLNATDADFHSVSWSVSGAASHGTATASGNGDSIAVSYVPATDYNGSDSFVIQASDGNGGTDTITVNVTITERNPPVITAVSAGTPASTSATVTWTTDEAASSKVRYGITSSYGTDTSETDTSPRVTSHSRTLTGLLACTTYHYAVVSADAAANSATSSDNTFTTAGCAGDATINLTAGSEIVANGNGLTGSLVLADNSLSLSVPAGYVSSNGTCPTGAQFQIKALTAGPVKDELGAPAGRASIVMAHDLSAYCPDFTRVTSFDETLTVVFTYEDADVAGLVESSLGVYRHPSGGAWEELTCTQDMGANTMTCGTTGFSSFAVFGTATVSSDARTGGVSAGGGGCRGEGCRAGVRANPFVSRQHPAATALAPACSAATLPARNGLLLSSIGGREVSFGDVPVAEWFACPVHDMVERGIFSGYRDASGNPTGLYGPGDPITMGQLAKVAAQLAARDVTPGAGEAWAQPYMDDALASGLTSFAGKPAAMQRASRGAVIVTILEALQIPVVAGDLPYADVPPGSLYADAVATATALGIVSGDGNADTFRPNAPVNRAEVAKMITLALLMH